MTQPGFEDIEGLVCTDVVREALAADGIRAPHEAQVRGIGAILEGRHTLLHAGTGTGKTLAYLLPVLQRLREDPAMRAVVFAPGVELAMQTLRVANRYKDEELITGAAVATASQRRQRKRITRSTRLVVGTPARLLELFASRKLKGVRLVVLDELESILRSRGADMLREVLSRSEPKVQLVVATATMDPASEAFVTRFMGEDVARITPEDNPLQQTISHRMVRMPPHQPPEMTLARFVQEHRCRQVIVFLTHPRHQASLYHYLRDRGLKPATLSHERSKRERRQAVEAFRRGEARILLTTDATARGLDIPGVAWVLHAGLPPSSSAYVHRAGRTGRAGESGTSVVFLDDAQRGRLRSLGKELGIRFEGYRR